MKKSKVLLPYFAAVIICLCVSIPIFSNSVVLDEAYSINLVRGTVREIIQGAAADVHPPLYYLILKFTGLFGGESLLKYRFITAAATWLNLIWLGATLIRKRWGNRVAVFYILWFGLAYGTFELSVLVRMYSWAAFFVTAAALFAAAYYEKGKTSDYITGIAMTLAAMYTHYYAVMSVFIIWLCLLTAVLVKKREKLKWVLAGGILITIGYLPWLSALISQSRKVAQKYWIDSFDWQEWFHTPAYLMESSLEGIGTVLFFFVFVLLLLACLRKQWDALLCITVFAGTMVMGALLSVSVTPIWQNRYLYAAWGLLSLFVAITAGQKVSAYSWIPQILFIVILSAEGVFSVQTMLQDEMMICSDDEWVDFLEENVEDNALIVVDDPYEHIAVFRYYLPEADIIMTEELQQEESRKLLEDALGQWEERQVWYIIDYVQPRYGVDNMTELLGQSGYMLDPAASCTIKYKSLGIFKAGEKIYEE